MKEKLLIALIHSMKGYLTETNAAPTIQRVLRRLSEHFKADYSLVALQNEHTAYLDMAYSNEVSRAAMEAFHRKIGVNAIGRIFFTEPLLVVTKSSDREDYQEFRLDRDYEMVVAVHLGAGGRSMGFLAAYFPEVFELDVVGKNFLMGMAGICSAALQKEELLTNLRQLQRFDVVTGAFCHQFFMACLEEEIGKSHRYQEPLTLGLMDVDNYKKIINTYGEPVAQAFLRQLVDELKRHIRGVDVLGSVGIDEFMIFMPNTTLPKGQQTLQTFREGLTTKRFTEHEIETSLSFGLTSLHNDDSIADLVHRVQATLYKARKNGKDSFHVEP